MRDGRTIGKSITILLVEDDLGDQDLTRRALQRGASCTDLRIVEDGEEALDYLHQREGYSNPDDAPRPDLILLDLNMPRMNGREVLAHIRDDASLALIPIIVLTTSRQEADILRSYDLGCNSFIQKPVDIEQFMDAIQKMGDYWFDIVTLPSFIAS